MATFFVSEAFQGAPVPAPWFRVLETDPVAAASQLLFGVGDFSVYQAAEPLHLALQWLREVRAPSFAKALDLAFSAWIRKFWGMSIHPDSAGSAPLTAEAWQNLSLILVGYPMLEEAAAALRERVLLDRNFLLAIGEGPASDPAGRALQAISRYQKDLTLRDFWWELAALPPSAPWFHGEYAIDGLSHLPFDGAGLPHWVPSGVRRLASALAQRVEEGWLDASLARRYFLRTARLAERRFPFERPWRRFWLNAYKAVKDSTAQSWIQSLNGFSDEQRKSDLGAGFVRPDPGWPSRAQQIAKDLAFDLSGTLAAAENLLHEQEAYLDRTGDAYFFVRSACNFASRIEHQNPAKALQWAQRARIAEPSNPFPWTIEFTCLRLTGRTAEALILGLETVARFPDDVVARNGLGEVLKAEGKLEEAEGIYRETVTRFTEDVFARTGLGEVLKAQGRLEEAEGVYRDSIARFPEDAVPRNGLGAVLKAQGRLEEAEQVYKECVECFPKDVVSRNGLGAVLKAQGRLEEAEQVYREVVARLAEDVYARNGLGEVLKAQGKLKQAEGIYRETVARFPENVVARNGLGDVLKAQGKLEEAEEVYRETVTRFPADAYARTGLGQVLKARGKLEEAEEIYRETIVRFPENEVGRNGLEEILKARGKLDAGRGADESEILPPDAPASGDAVTTQVDQDRMPLLHDRTEDAGSIESTITAPPHERKPQKAETQTRHEEPVAPRLSPAEVEILLADFVLLRKWAPRDVSIHQVRERIRALLDRVGPHLFDDPVLSSEEALLLVVSDLDEARSFLHEASRRFPGSAKVAYARARAERLHVRSQRPEFQSDLGRQALLAWDRLARIDTAMEPLHLLGLSRTLPLLHDGAGLEAQKRKRLGQLAFRLHRMTTHSREGSFDPAWAGSVQRIVFAGESIQNAGELPSLAPIVSRLDGYSEQLDRLESEYIDARAVV